MLHNTDKFGGPYHINNTLNYYLLEIDLGTEIMQEMMHAMTTCVYKCLVQYAVV